MFDNYKFRSSEVGNLFVEPRSKSETLSETTKTWLDTIFIREYFGREKEIQSKYLTKGNEVEEQAITLLQEVSNYMILFKNETHYKNDYITGTPDIVTDDEVIDIKSCWDLFSFRKKDESNKMYYYQLQSYMMLTGMTKATLAYCLVNTPEHLIDIEIRKATYQYDVDELPQVCENIKRNCIFDDIPHKQRVQTYGFDYLETFEERLIEKVIFARQHLNELFLIEENKIA